MNTVLNNRLAYRLIFISLAFFLLGKGIDYYNIFVFISAIFFSMFVAINNSLLIPRWKELNFAIVIFVIYSVRLIGAPAWPQDVKNYIFMTYGILLFYNFMKFFPPNYVVKCLTTINIIIFIIYVLLNFKLIPNLYATDEAIAEYKNYRVPGPIIIIFYAVPLFCLFRNIKFKKYIYVNLVLGFLTSFIAGGLQNFLIFIIINIIYFISLEGKKIIKVSIALITLATIFSYYIENYVSENYAEKISSVLNPMEAQTVQTRIGDLLYMLNKGIPENKLLGDGIGTTSNVYRINPFNVKLSWYNTFLEIDNGFYYVFHRFGFLGLLFFCLAHFQLIKRSHPIKFKICFLVFFLITNLLSIHYFTVPATSFFITLLFFSAYSNKVKKVKAPPKYIFRRSLQI